MKGARALIHLQALRHNFRRVRQLAPHSRILAMVKADAYGHGLFWIAPYLGHILEADALGVARLDEGLLLRSLNIKKPIFLMEGFGYEQELQTIEEHDLGLILHESFQVEALLQHRFQKKIPLWIKVNTGMNRLGFQAKTALWAYQTLVEHTPSFSIQGLMTHFAQADDPNHPLNQEQILRFDHFLKQLPPQESAAIPRSLANSAAILSRPDTHADWVRPGILLYGVSPFQKQLGADLGLKPVMSFESDLIAIYDLLPGDQVGYGGHFKATRDMRVGIVAAGYGDGYPVIAPNGTPVWTHGRRCPLIGRVSMDMVAIDLNSVTDARIGDRVVLWGPELPMEEVAAAMGVIPYSLCCGVTQRVRREIISEPWPLHMPTQNLMI